MTPPVSHPGPTGESQPTGPRRTSSGSATAAQPDAAPATVGAICDGGPLHFPPGFPTTLAESLASAAARQPAHGVVCLDETLREVSLGYPQLWQEATCVLGALTQRGLRPGDRVLLQITSPRDFFPAFWGCVLGRFVPAPLVVPPSYPASPPAAERLQAVWQKLDRPMILAAGEVLGQLQSGISTGQLPPYDLLDARELRDAAAHAPQHVAQPEDLALLLFTSGSSGQAKGVRLSHRNLLSMAAGTAQANSLDERDVIFNWLPLDHVGALSFLHLMGVALGCQQVHAATSGILRDLPRWLDALSRYRATIAWAPDFAFRQLVTQADTLAGRDWNLSRLRFLVNAGEPVSRATALEFTAWLQVFGLPADAIRPAFGMSETCSGITWADRGIAQAPHGAPQESSSATDAVELGPPIPGAALRIVDDHQRLLPEGAIGRLQVRGPSVTSGYYADPEQTAAVFTSDGWFQTGDLGCLREGRLTLTGREKHILIVRGVHYAAAEIERLIESLPGITTSCTAALPVRRTGESAEAIAIFFSPTAALLDPSDAVALAAQIRQTLARRFAITPDYLVSLPVEAVPKSSIGKIEKSQLQRRFERGEFDHLFLPTHAQQPVPQPPPSSAPDARSLEKQIAAIWRELLHLPRIDPHDNFFDLGGTSVLLAQLEGRLEESLGVRVVTADLLAHPTVRAQARLFAHVDTPSTANSQATASHDPREVATQGFAIVGLACRFPDAPNLETFWENIRLGRESIRFFPNGSPPHTPRDPRHPHFVPAVPWLDGVEQFDAEFFGMSPREADRTDPQHRLLLECAADALEHAGYDSRRTSGRIGVFASAGVNTYQARAQLLPDLEADFEHDLVAGAIDFLATRVAYKLDLRGPALNVQTACSSGIVALHLACQSLARGECELALVGGASIWHLEPRGYQYHPGSLVSPDGHCRPFDAQAAGMVFGNGAAAILLKPLQQALADRDTIHAVVLGSAINNDGSEKAGFLATGLHGQARVIQQALASARLRPSDISYVECHGTGTLLGDAIEFGGLQRAFGPTSDAAHRCALGSVKANIGHMGAACGLAGLIKTVLALAHRELPPQAMYTTPNPQLDFQHSPFYIPTAPTPWNVSHPSAPRRAGVSSFGLGGTNAHCILEEPPARSAASPSAAPQLLPLSARTPDALAAICLQLADHLRRHPELALVDVANTLQLGRREHRFRRALVCHDLADATSQMTHAAQQSVNPVDDDVLDLPVEVTSSLAPVSLPPDTLSEIGRQWESGRSVDWSRIGGERSAHRVPLPTYPFQRRRHWLDITAPQSAPTPSREPSPLSPAPAPASPHPAPPAATSTSTEGAAFAAQLRTLPMPQRKKRLLERLAQETRQLLPADAARALDPRVGFIELGLTSAGAIELIHRVEGLLGLELAQTLLFEFPNLHELTAHLLTRIAHPSANG